MITCLHTAAIHVETFSDLLPDARHVVREDLLVRARQEGVEAVAGEVMELLGALASEADVVLCTCSTLGPLADAAGVLRIDRPAFEAAAALEGDVVLAICLDSTAGATLALFDEIAGAGRGRLVHCADAWPFFERGDMAGYAERIATRLRTEAKGAAANVLAQASMAVAAPLLEAEGVAVITTPQAAAKAALKAAQG